MMRKQSIYVLIQKQKFLKFQKRHFSSFFSFQIFDPWYGDKMMALFFAEKNILLGFPSKKNCKFQN